MKTNESTLMQPTSRPLRTLFNLALAIFSSASLPVLFAGGTLTPQGSSDAPARILNHHVDVVIQNGFARTEVTQVFNNPNPHQIEAIYAFPVPLSASLSEVIIQIGEREMRGEVLG